MADEQDWSGYMDQPYVSPTNTLLARTAAGAGVEIPGDHVVARRMVDGPFEVAGRLVGGFGALSTVGVADWNDISQARSGQGSTLLAGAALNSPPVGSLFHPFNFEHNAKNGTGNLTQFAVPYFDNSGYYGMRFRYAGTWSSWRAILFENANGQFLPSTDNANTLGTVSRRFSVVYAGTGAINTSDERDKVWRGAITDDEYAAALQIIDELGFYQWEESVAEKGPDGARYHFGPRAQRAFAILDDHLGADAWHSYAFACYDSWDDEYDIVVDENGEVEETLPPTLVNAAGDRYGLREGQFTLFLLAAQARRQKELELRIEALEA